MKLNPFSLILFFMHKVAYSWTPIHTERYLSQCEEESRSAALADESLKASRKRSHEIEVNLWQRHRSEPIYTVSGDHEQGGEHDHCDDKEDNNNLGAGEDQFASRRETYDCAELSWRHFVLHPIELVQLIKRYHLVGNYFLVGNLIQFLILIHLLVKSVIMLVAERPPSQQPGGVAPRQVREYYKSAYYPYMPGGFSEPYSMNAMLLVLTAFCLCSRILSAIQLVRGSIINQKRYRQIWVSQINLVPLTLAWLTPAEWVAFWRQATWHSKALRRTKLDVHADESEVQQFRRHLHLDETVLSNIDKCSMHELMYRSDAIEFSRCYGNIVFRLPEERDASQRSWFVPARQHMLCICSLRAAILFSLIGSMIIIGLGALFFISVLMLEVRGSMAKEEIAQTWWGIAVEFWSSLQLNGFYNTMAGWMTNLVEHFSDPVHLIRSLELYAFLLLNIPNHIDAVVGYANLVVMIGRIAKLSLLFEHESKLSDHVGGIGGPNYSSLLEQSIFEDLHNSKPDASMRASLPFRQQLPLADGFKSPSSKSKSKTSVTEFVNSQLSRRNSIGWAAIEVQKANARILQLVKLSNLLYYEFTDLRSLHSLYFNLVFIGNGICMSYMLALFSVVKDPVQFLLLLIALLSSLVPTLVMLTCCAVLERRFKTLYMRMVRLMSNRDHRLEFRTLERLRVASRLIEKKEGRAMLIFGKYAITQDSMTPIIAYMATAILYLH